MIIKLAENYKEHTNYMDKTIHNMKKIYINKFMEISISYLQKI